MVIKRVGVDITESFVVVLSAKMSLDIFLLSKWRVI